MNVITHPETPRQGANRLSESIRGKGFRPDGLFTYHDANGNAWCHRFRCKHPDGRPWVRSMHLVGDAFVEGEPPKPPNGTPLYRPPYPLVETNPVLIVPDENSANALAERGITATTCGSVGRASDADWTPLCGHSALVLTGSDKPGAKYAGEVVSALRALDCPVEVVDASALNLPVVDWLREHPDATAADVLALPLLSAPTVTTEVRNSAIKTFDSEGRPRKQTDVLVDIGVTHDLFHDGGGQPYARLPVGDHVEVHAVESIDYRELLARTYYTLTGKGCNRNAMADAITTLSSRAKFDGECHPVWLRTAKTDNGIAIDTGSADWRVISVTADGWEVGNGGDVHFRRTGKPLALPALSASTRGDFGKLWNYLNVRKEDRVLIAAFLLAVLRPTGPYPVLLLSGEQGAGKSTFARTLKAITDPSASPLRSPPKEPRDLLVGALNSWLLCIDNLSWLPALLSDSLCRLSTGGAISERTLYSNLGETLVEVMRPVVLNGIEELATRPDLAQRGIHIELTAITDTHQRKEQEYWAAFSRDAPAIFAGLLDGLVMALRDVDSVRIDRLPRMADLATWAEAGLPALGFKRGDFLRAYRENQNIGLSLGLESSAVGRAVLAFMVGRTTWTGTAANLLGNLANKIDDDQTLRSQAWPKSSKGLHGHLNRLGPALRSAGIRVERGRTEHDRLITLCRVPQEASEASGTVSADTSDTSDTLSGGLNDAACNAETYRRARDGEP